MQIQAIKHAPKALKMLPVVATMALSSITAVKANEQNNELMSKAASDSITAVTKGTVAANNNDTITFEDAINDSIANALTEKRDTVLNYEKKISDKVKLGFTVEGTGAESVLNKVLSDLSLSSVGTPYSGAYKALCEEKKSLEARGFDTSDIDEQIDALEDMMKDYIRDNAEIVAEKVNVDSTRTTFHYGKDKSKIGYITQTIGLKGNGGIKDQRSQDTNEAANDSTQTNNSDNKNRFDGGVTYGLKVETENSDIRFDGDFDSDNIDLSLSAETKRQTENGKISAALSVRETVNPEYHEGSGGLSLDYISNSNDFTAGAYAYYEYAKQKGEDLDFGAQFAGLLRYKDNVKFEVGDEYSEDLNYLYSKLNLKGSKKFDNNDLKLSGRLEAEYGASLFPAEAKIKPIQNLEVKARGNMIFSPEDDMLATLGLGVNYGCSFGESPVNAQYDFDHDVSANVLGSFKKGKLGISAMISLMYATYQDNMNNLAGATQMDPLKISSNVSIELQDLFKGITPFVSYTLTTGVESGREHNIGGGVRLGVDKLSNKKK